MYSYGPFTQQLLGDLDQVEHFGYLEVEPVKSGFGGYAIRPTKNIDSLKEKAGDFFNSKTEEALAQLINDYGCMTARDLELRATVVYVERDFRRKNRPAHRDEVISLVSDIKPKFSNGEILNVVDDLNSRGHIQVTS